MLETLGDYAWQFGLMAVTALATYKVSQHQFEKRANKTALMEIYQLVAEFNHVGWKLEPMSDPKFKHITDTRAEQKELQEQQRKLAKLVALKAYEITDAAHHELIASLILGMQGSKSINYSLPKLAMIGCTEDLAKVINKPLIDEVNRQQKVGERR